MNCHKRGKAGQPPKASSLIHLLASLSHLNLQVEMQNLGPTLDSPWHHSSITCHIACSLPSSLQVLLGPLSRTSLQPDLHICSTLSDIWSPNWHMALQGWVDIMVLCS